MSDKFKYIHPETLQEVEFSKLPKAYRESIDSNKRAQDYAEVYNVGDEPEETVYKDLETKKRMTTDDGKELSTPLRAKKQGGLKLVKDPRYDPEKSWRYPYGKQLVEVKKPTSHLAGKKKWNLIYTKEYAVVHGAVKFEMIRSLANVIPEAKKKWTDGMLSKDERKMLCATMCAMSNESPFRSGSMTVATRGKNKTYGITTLLCKHVSIVKDEDGKDIVYIRFLGKGRELIKKYIKNPLAVVKIKKLLKGKEPDDFLFTDSNGGTIGADELNKYCKSLGIPHFHFFRHLRASQRFKEAVDEMIADNVLPDMPTSKEIAKLITTAAEESAELLGNQGATCIKNYIAPQLMFDVFKQFNLPVPDVFKNLARMPANVTEKDLQEIMQSKYKNGSLDMEDEEELDALESSSIETKAYSEDITVDEKPLFNDSKTSYIQDEANREAFEEYLMEYEYDDDDIINDPAVVEDLALAHVMVPEDFTPDFELVEKHVSKRGDEYHVENSKEFSCRDSSSVDKWGYNDSIGMTPEEVNKKMMEDARRDIERLTKEINK